jgi:TonB-dependent SusC/RagA subfamily outer membrane receptor
MILQLMLGSLLIATLMTGAAVTTEAGLRVYGRPARWIWVLALVGSIGLPLLHVLAPDIEPVQAGGSVVGSLVSGAESLVLPPPVASLTTPQPWWARMDVPLIAVWCIATGGLLVSFFGTAHRLGRERRSWRRVKVGGVTAWLSRDVGPAVIGIGASSIVVPAWVLELESAVQRLIAIHEEEHLRAGDLPVMIAGLLLVLMAPWNPVLWWQLRRLRLAVEVDCDGRVLRRGVGVMAYCSLLLKVCDRSTRHHLPALAFMKQTSTLARRIHLMTWKPRMRVGRAICAATLAVIFTALACETTTVTVVDTETPETQLVAEVADTSLVFVREVVDHNGSPLYVVDGVIVARGMIEDMDPRDIESIEVIKGGAALDTYGERAANGLVMVTTGGGKPEAVSIVEEIDSPEAQRVAEPREGARTTGTEGDSAVPTRGSGESLVEGPLLVVDGVVVGTAVGRVAQTVVVTGAEATAVDLGVLETLDIEPHDIDRIEVVKGNAAEEIYGKRGANGVVVITTKKGEGAETSESEPIDEWR